MSATARPGMFSQAVIILIAIVQFALGIVFVFFPHSFPDLLGLAPPPAWTDWIFAQFGARSFGFAYGMWLVLRDTHRHAGWMKAMIGVQVVDWVGTILALTAGKVSLAQVTTAPFLPLLFVIVLAMELRPRADATKLMT